MGVGVSLAQGLVLDMLDSAEMSAVLKLVPVPLVQVELTSGSVVRPFKIVGDVAVSMGVG